MQRIFLTMLVLVMTFGSSSGADRLAGGNMLGRTLYWETDGFSTDTLGWAFLEKSVLGVPVSGSKTVRQACDTLEKQSKAVLRVKEPAALSMAILVDLGYRPVCLTQWVGTTDAQINVVGPGTDEDYKHRRLLSDMQWETVSKVDVEKPTTMHPEFVVRLDFGPAGYAEFADRELVTAKGVQISGTSDGLVLVTDRGWHSEDITMKRTIRAVYIVLDKGVKPATVVSQIEKTMDKLGLDLSYKPPELSPVKCK